MGLAPLSTACVCTHSGALEHRICFTMHTYAQCTPLNATCSLLLRNANSNSHFSIRVPKFSISSTVTQDAVPKQHWTQRTCQGRPCHYWQSIAACPLLLRPYWPITGWRGTNVTMMSPLRHYVVLMGPCRMYLPVAGYSS